MSICLAGWRWAPGGAVGWLASLLILADPGRCTLTSPLNSPAPSSSSSQGPEPLTLSGTGRYLHAGPGKERGGLLLVTLRPGNQVRAGSFGVVSLEVTGEQARAAPPGGRVGTERLEKQGE